MPEQAVTSQRGGPLHGLSPRQAELLGWWLPDAVVVRDHTWRQVERAVLEVVHHGARFVVKAGGVEDGHMPREIQAHLRWLEPLTRRGRAPELVHHDEDARILVTRYLPGELVLGHASADDASTYRQAGELLADLHAQTAVADADHEQRENDRALAWLDGPHRIAPATAERLREEIRSWPLPPAVLVPTHGDWQPRNWLVHDGSVRVIDFGRAAMRPAMTDLARLAAQVFLRDRRFEAAFLEGYGDDPREPEAWHRTRVREAVATAAWAHRVGDEGFEAQGQRMVASVLDGR